MIETMQNYLANKSFNRGGATHEATASMAFIGNTKHTVPYMLKNTHLFESIPEAFIKGAFLDRIHYYSPGWEVRVLKKTWFSDGFGFISDYLAELLHELRKQDFSSLMNQYVKFDNSLSERDHNAIRKTFSGLMKLIYPDKNITQEEALELIDFAVEGRKNSIDAFDEIKESVAEIGIDFNYEFKNIHDRKISTDTGWDIILGRGLDIFEPRKGYSIDEFLQEHRKCKAFSITYFRS
ncbi:MAG: BREX system Lon protease-like protein BrxL [Proteiniphilum sp.]